MGVTRDIWVHSAQDEDDYYQLNIGPKSVSAKGLVDAFAREQAKQILEVPGSPASYFHSVLLCAGEIGTMMPEYDTRLASQLNDIYNCGDKVDDQIRNGKGEPVESDNPHITVMLGTQPSFLASTFPEEAYGMGFFARLNLVFEPRLQRKPLYPEADGAILARLAKEKAHEWQKLVSDLRQMLHLSGPITVPKPVQRIINKFHLTGCDASAPTHTRFKDYNVRRSFHLQKLAICFSVARSPKLIVEEQDWDRAMDLMLRTEKRLPSIFANQATGDGFHNSVEELVHSAEANKGIISERAIQRQLRRKHRVHEVKPIMQSAIDSGDLVELPGSAASPTGRKFRISAEGSRLISK